MRIADNGRVANPVKENSTSLPLGKDIAVDIDTPRVSSLLFGILSAKESSTRYIALAHVFKSRTRKTMELGNYGAQIPN